MKPDAPEIPVDLADPFLVDFHRQVAVRSAAPCPDREPEKRGLPPTPPLEPEKAQSVDSRAFAPEAVETYRRVQQLGIDVSGVISTKAFIGKSEDGRTPPGAYHWSHCFGRQPVYVHGAVYADAPDTARAMRVVDEAARQRKQADKEMRKVLRANAARALGMTTSRLRRAITARNKNKRSGD